MFYEIENHAKAYVAVSKAKRALREAENNLREHERHMYAQPTTSHPKTVIVDGTHAVTLDRQAQVEWNYVIGEMVSA